MLEKRAEYEEKGRQPSQYYPCVDIRSGGLGPEQAVCCDGWLLAAMLRLR